MKKKAQPSGSSPSLGLQVGLPASGRSALVHLPHRQQGEFSNPRHDSFFVLLKTCRWFPSPLISKLLSIRKVPFTVLPQPGISPSSAPFSYAPQLPLAIKGTLIYPCRYNGISSFWSSSLTLSAWSPPFYELLLIAPGSTDASVCSCQMNEWGGHI